MKIVHINQQFKVGAPMKQPTAMTCMPTVLRMLLNRDDVPMIEGVTISFAGTTNRRGTFNMLYAVSIDEPMIENWINANGYRIEFHINKPKDRASILFVAKVKGNTIRNSHAILALGDYGYVDPVKGYFDMNNDDDRMIAGYATIEKVGN